MIGVPIEMPETCEACLCNVHECYCGVTGNFFNFDETTRRADDCPLVDLSGEHVPVNNVGNIEYIEKKKVIDALEKVAGFFPYKVPGNADTYLPYNEAWNDAIGRAEMEMESLEPADVVQVVHGKWEKRESGLFYCTECGLPSMHKWPYCEQCGAKMDAQGEE